MKLPAFHKQLALAAIAFTLAVPAARADIYATNLATTTDSVYTLNSAAWMGTQFTTDASASTFTLNSVTIHIYDSIAPGSPFSLQVFSDSAGTPGILLGALSGNSAPGTLGDYTYTASGVSLNASTSYWLVAEVTGASTYRLGATSDPTVTGGWSIAPQVDVSSNSGVDWTTAGFVGTRQEYAVDATADPVPEPSTYAMLGLGVSAMLGAMRLRKLKS